jgi:hypothetical protein
MGSTFLISFLFAEGITKSSWLEEPIYHSLNGMKRRVDAFVCMFLFLFSLSLYIFILSFFTIHKSLFRF